MKQQNTLEIDWVNTVFLTSTPIIGLILSWIYFKGHGFEWSQILLAIAFYFITGISITAGYHRLISHKAYKAGPVVKFLYLLFGAATFQNSALKWCSDHRIHHRHVDGEKDPYNINKGFFWAHIGWIFYKDPHTGTDHFPKDLLNDKL
ncbi:MAG: acyl-CoA desaturase, partial [Bacteriovorax sp.]